MDHSPPGSCVHGILQARILEWVAISFSRGSSQPKDQTHVSYVSQKNIYFCFIDYAKAFDCMDHNKLWKILKEMGIPDHLTCLLRNLYAGQEATVRTGHGTHCFQIGKGVRQGCILSPCLFNLYLSCILGKGKKMLFLWLASLNICRVVDLTTLA